MVGLAASCRRESSAVLPISAEEYTPNVTRSNVMNWGMLPFQMEANPEFEVGDYIYIPGIVRNTLGNGRSAEYYSLCDWKKY